MLRYIMLITLCATQTPAVSFSQRTTIGTFRLGLYIQCYYYIYGNYFERKMCDYNLQETNRSNIYESLLRI